MCREYIFFAPRKARVTTTVLPESALVLQVGCFCKVNQPNIISAEVASLFNFHSLGLAFLAVRFSSVVSVGVIYQVSSFMGLFL